LPTDAVTDTGAPGISIGVTGLEAAEGVDGPFPFVAVTVKVYGTPFESPVIAQASAAEVEHVRPPGDAVTVYEVTGRPPLDDGGCHVTRAELL
jgi:hypothetical protein